MVDYSVTVHKKFVFDLTSQNLNVHILPVPAWQLQAYCLRAAHHDVCIRWPLRILTWVVSIFYGGLYPTCLIKYGSSLENAHRVHNLYETVLYVSQHIDSHRKWIEYEQHVLFSFGVYIFYHNFSNLASSINWSTPRCCTILNNLCLPHEWIVCSRCSHY